jgi:hypothetical protein
MKYLPTVLLVSIFMIAANIAGAQKRLAIIGSSTSACFNISPFDSCYVGRLYDYFNKNRNNDTAVDNGYAVPGYSCYRGMPTSFVSPYPDPNLQPDPAKNITAAIASHPDVIIANYPTNSYDTLRIDSILYCLRTIRDSANKAGIPCFITTTQPRSQFSLPARTKLNELKDSILLEMGFFAIDFWNGLTDPADFTILPAYNSGDNIHFNSAGHDTLFQRVLAKNIFLATLPATFLQFNAVYKNNTNVITWTTAKETQVNYYEIQRSADGINFSQLSQVAANNSNGNNQYQYTDAGVLKGWNYYKIVIVDKDEKKHDSPVMRVYINPGKLAIVKAFARSSSQVAIELQNNDPENADIQILNNTGMVVSKSTRTIEAGNTTLFINTPVLSNGVYHIKITTAKESMVSSFIKN